MTKFNMSSEPVKTTAPAPQNAPATPPAMPADEPAKTSTK